MNDTVRTGLNRVRLPISPSTHIINNYYTDFLTKSQEKNKNDVNELCLDLWSLCQIRFTSSREHDKIREFFISIDSKSCYIGQSRRNGSKGIRTLKNRTLRRRVLYPVELWNQNINLKSQVYSIKIYNYYIDFWYKNQVQLFFKLFNKSFALTEYLSA